MNTSFNAVFQFITGVYNVMVSNWIMAIPLAIWLIFLAREMFNQIKKIVKGG